MLKYKHNRKLITLKCDCCGKEFEKPVSEYKRNTKFGRANYCSRACSGKMCNKNNRQKGNPSVLIPSNRRDQYTPFRYYFRNARKRFKDFDLSLEYLKQLWDEQKGICPYTGIHLQLAEYKANHNDPIYTASLDRIDSSKGYIKGNVQFISTAINYMKNNMSHEDTITLCKIIAKHVVELEASESLVQTTNQMT